MAVHERGQLEGIWHEQLAARAGLQNTGVAWQRRVHRLEEGTGWLYARLARKDVWYERQLCLLVSKCTSGQGEKSGNGGVMGELAEVMQG